MPNPPSRQKQFKRAVVEDALRQEFAGTLAARVERSLAVEQLPLVLLTSIAAASAECLNLYRDGHFYGCISLCQSVGEALVRFLCEKNGFAPKKVFEKNLEVLLRRQFIDDAFRTAALRLWASRDDFHHMNSAVPSDAEQLLALSREKLHALVELEKWVFAFNVSDGKVVPKRRKYWPDATDGKTSVYLRIS